MGEDPADFVRQECVDECREWGKSEWDLFRVKVVEVSRGGTITGRGIRHCVAAVNATRVPLAAGVEAPSTVDGQRLSGVLDEYLADVRRKFEQLLASHHQRELASYVETMYRDLVFTRR